MRKYLAGILLGATLVGAPFFIHQETQAAAVVTGKCRIMVYVNMQPTFITKPDDFCHSELVYAPAPNPLPTPCPMPGIPCAAVKGN